MKNIALIFAGGTGKRMGIEDVPKQFLEVDGTPIIIHTIKHFEDHPEISEIYVVCIESWIEYLKYQLDKHNITKVTAIRGGGATGQDSIYKGLCMAREHCEYDDIVLIHDGVRPFIDAGLISRNIHDTKLHGNSITSTGCFETFIISKNGVDVDNVPVRSISYNAQAPQAFRLGEIISAHNEIRKTNPDYENVVDSCTLFHLLGRPVFLTEGVRGNVKVTNPVDIYIFKAWQDFKNNGEKAMGIPSLEQYEKYIEK